MAQARSRYEKPGGRLACQQHGRMTAGMPAAWSRQRRQQQATGRAADEKQSARTAEARAAALWSQTDRHFNQDKASPPCDPNHVLSRGSDSASQRARSDLQVCLASSEPPCCWHASGHAAVLLARKTATQLLERACAMPSPCDHDTLAVFARRVLHVSAACRRGAAAYGNAFRLL